MSRNFPRRHAPRRRSLGLQPLETRGMLAGDVAISLSGTTLSLVGDALGNSITLDETAGTLTITGIGTTLNGGAAPVNVPTANFTRIVLTMNAGDDTVAFLPSLLALKDIAANLGSATAGDIFTASNLTAQDLSVTSGNGSDTIDLDTILARNVTLRMGGKLAGTQSLDLDNLTLTGALNINAGVAADAAGTTIDLDASNVTGVVAMITNSAGCAIDVDSLIGSALTIRSVASTDLDLGTALANDLSGALNVTVGANSSITVGGAAVVGNVADGLGTLVAGGNSSVSVVDVEFNNNLIVKTANGAVNSIVLDGIDIAGNLSIAMGNVTTNTLTVFDDDGLTDIGGSVAIVLGNPTGANNFTLGGPTADLSIVGNTGLTMGNGTNNLSVENVAINNPGTSKSGLVITNRNGNNTVEITSVAVEAGATVRAGNAPIQNVVTIDDLTTAEGSLLVAVGTASGLPNDIDLLNSAIGVGFSYDITITAAGGLGSDLNVSNVDVGRNLIITTKDGDDVINVDGVDVVGRTQINTGKGEDDVTLGATSTSTFALLVTIILGDDNDDLEIGFFVDDSAGTAFDIAAYNLGFDGGAGIDAVNSSLVSFIPSSVLLNLKIQNFESRTP